MPIDFDKDETEYKAIKDGILQQRSEGMRAVLNIHIPGTGGVKDDRFPTLVALTDLKQERPTLPIVRLEGVGSEGMNYIPPALNATNTLANRKKSTGTRVQQGLAIVALGSQADDIATLGDSAAQVAGFVSGAGYRTNNERLTNALLALQEDDALPDVIHLCGHSRGAVNCISFSMEIYKVFGTRIETHLALTDPVPGPHFMREHPEEKIISPNVASFTCMYAGSVEEKYFEAIDVNSLVFTNPKTTVTCYSIPETNHASVLHSIGGRAIKMVINSINEVERNYIRGFGKGDFDTSTMYGSGSREGQNFYFTTPIRDNLPSQLQSTLRAIRAILEKDYVNEEAASSTVEHNHFEHLDRVTAAERSQFLQAAYKEAKKKNLDPYKRTDAQTGQPFQTMLRLQNDIFTKAKSEKPNDGQKWVKVNIKEGGQSSFSERYITPQDQKILHIIRSATKKSSRNPLSVEWVNCQEQVNRLLGTATTATTQHSGEPQFGATS